MENAKCAISRGISKPLSSYHFARESRRLPRNFLKGDARCPRIRGRRQDLPLHVGAVASTRGRRGEEEANEKERRDEWPYETLGITKSNTANVARRRKNSEDEEIKESRQQHYCVRSRPVDAFPSGSEASRTPLQFTGTTSRVYSWHLV